MLILLDSHCISHVKSQFDMYGFCHGWLQLFCNLIDQSLEPPLLKTLLISDVQTSCPNWNFGFCLTLQSWKLNNTFVSFTSLLALTGVIFTERWIVLIYCLVIDGTWDIQSAFPFSNTGFFSKLCIVLLTPSTIVGALTVNLEKYCIFLTFKKFGKIELWSFASTSDSSSIDFFYLVRILENSFVIFWLFLIFKRTHQVYFEIMSIIMRSI